MQAGLILLFLAYVLSQFFRAFLAVLSGPLEADIGAGPDDLAFASGLWFLIFALMQLPVGALLDKTGPRRTAAALLLLGGGGGAALFALAAAPWQISVAMALIGIGCSPVLMASYYIFAREYPPARFATLAGLMLGLGSLGNLVASYPTAVAVDLIGWRASMGVLAIASAGVAAGIFVTVRDPAPTQSDSGGSVLTLLRMPVMWAILPMMLVNYAPAAALRGLWIGPYLTDVFGQSTSQIGTATLIMGAAMIVGTLCYSPADRLFGTRKWVVFVGNLTGALALFALVATIGQSVWLSIALISIIGFCGGSFPVLVAHGRAFFPPHLVGRGVTLMNLFGIGGVGLMQFVSGRLHDSTFDPAVPTAPYTALFALFGVTLLTGVVIYLFSRDNMG